MAISLAQASQKHVVSSTVAVATTVTLSGWCKMDSLSTTSFAFCLGSTAAWHDGIQVSTGAGAKFTAYGYDSSGGHLSVGTTVVSTGIWYHVAVTRKNNSYVHLYVNGVKDGTSAAIGTGQTAGDALVVGGGYLAGTTGFFDGNVEDVRYWNGQELGSFEMGLLAAGYRGPLGLEKVWFPLSFSDGEAISSAAGQVFDMSGNNLHGKAQNACVGIASVAPRMSGWIP